MKAPKFLLSTYQTAFLEPGGGETELIDLHHILSTVDVESDIYGFSSSPIDSYVAVLHFSTHPEGLALLQKVKERKKKIFLWANLWWRSHPELPEIENVKRFFDIADYVVFKSQTEFRNVTNHIEVPADKVVIIKVPYDTRFLEKPDKELFKRLYTLDDYVLWVGAINPVKNQLVAIKALRNLGVRTVFIGHPTDNEYFSRCLMEATPDILFVPNMPCASSILRSAMSGCIAYLEIPSEPPGVSAIEAALMGKPLVLTDSDWNNEHFLDQYYRVDARDNNSITRALEGAMTVKGSVSLASHVRKTHLPKEALAPLLNILHTF